MSITVRKMRFGFPAEMDAVFIQGEPEESYMHIALSLLLPYLEPYLIRSMRAARPHLRDEALRDDLDKFVGQEGQHYRQHRAFNETFRDRGFDELPAREAELDADYQRFSKDKSLRFNLAYAEGFEAMTTAMARVALERDMSRWHPAARDLFLWHLMEELEHRTVAFDVYDHVCGGWPYRFAVGAFAQWHLLQFIKRTMQYMLAADPTLLERHGGDEAHRMRMRRLNGRFLGQVVPKVLWTYMPWYTPHHIAVPEAMQALAAHYSERQD